MSLDIENVDELNYYIREFIRNNLEIQISTENENDGWVNNTNNLKKGRNTITLKLGQDTIGEYTL
jgi:hypothetical protein